MRPVERGASPKQSYPSYGDAAEDLEARLGRYCSYCERRLETHLAVEHIRPKSSSPALAVAWQNFLVACVNCNSCKGDTPILLTDYLWPDVDNTLRAFRHAPGGTVDIDTSIPAPLQTRANALRVLVGLDRVPATPTPPSASDLRWERRRETWLKASRARGRLATADSTSLREQIAETAQESGMFSIWWEAFAGDTDMRRRLRQAFLGTCPNSFDANENLQARPGGQL